VAFTLHSYIDSLLLRQWILHSKKAILQTVVHRRQSSQKHFCSGIFYAPFMRSSSPSPRSSPAPSPSPLWRRPQPFPPGRRRRLTSVERYFWLVYHHRPWKGLAGSRGKSAFSCKSGCGGKWKGADEALSSSFFLAWGRKDALSHPSPISTPARWKKARASPRFMWRPPPCIRRAWPC